MALAFPGTLVAGSLHRDHTADYATMHEAAMAEEHGEEFLAKVRFKGCSRLVRSFLSIAVSEGMRKHRELHAGG